MLSFMQVCLWETSTILFLHYILLIVYILNNWNLVNIKKYVHMVVRNIFGSHLRVWNKVNVGYVLRYTSPQSRVKKQIVENLYLKTCTRMHFYLTIKYDNSIWLQYSNTEAAKYLLTNQNTNKYCGRNHTYKKDCIVRAIFVRDLYCKISEELFSKPKKCNEILQCTLKT